MFNYKGATNLVGLLNALKIVGMVITILLTVSGVASGVIRMASYTSDADSIIGLFTIILSVVFGAFWTAVVYAVFGVVQHHLAAVTHTAFLADERAKLGFSIQN